MFVYKLTTEIINIENLRDLNIGEIEEILFVKFIQEYSFLFKNIFKER